MIPCRFGCSLSFATVTDADAHVQLAHAAPRVDSLNPRNFSLANNQQANHYEQLSPQPILPSQCEMCQKFFSTAADLDSHKARRHTQQSSLQCPIPSCGATFIEQTALISHIITAHGNNQAPALNVQSSTNSLTSAFGSLSVNQVPQTRQIHQAPTQHLSSLAAPTALWNQSSYSMQPQFGSQSFGTPWNQLAKSGQDRLSHHRPKVHVLWPHECIDSILAKRTYAYKELSSSALAAGSLSSLFRMNEFYACPESMQVFLEHLSFIFHCLSYSNNVKAILDFHASILSQIEAGLLSWTRAHEQTFTLQRLNFRSGL